MTIPNHTRELLIMLSSHMAYMQGQLEAFTQQSDPEDFYWFRESVALRQKVIDALDEGTQVIEPPEQTLPVPVPVPVSERLPEAEDCDAEGRCWLLTYGDDYPQWRLHSIQGAQPGGVKIWVPVDCFYTSHWLPANAVPLPAVEVGR